MLGENTAYDVETAVKVAKADNNDFQVITEDVDTTVKAAKADNSDFKGTAEDVDTAVKAAKAAHASWSKLRQVQFQKKNILLNLH